MCGWSIGSKCFRIGLYKAHSTHRPGQHCSPGHVTSAIPGGRHCLAKLSLSPVGAGCFRALVLGSSPGTNHYQVHTHPACDPATSQSSCEKSKAQAGGGTQGPGCRAKEPQTLVQDVLEATQPLTAWIILSSAPSSRKTGEETQACCLTVFHLLGGEEFTASVESHSESAMDRWSCSPRSGRQGLTEAGGDNCFKWGGAQIWPREEPIPILTEISFCFIPHSSVEHRQVLRPQCPASFPPAASEKRQTRARRGQGSSWSCGQAQIQLPTLLFQVDSCVSVPIHGKSKKKKKHKN